MKISMQWLQEWVNVTLSPNELASMLTMLGLEVSQISPVSGAFTGVVVAEVLDIAQHPEADRLTLCQVQATPGQVLQVVCGAANVRPGLKVALAQVGACLPNGLTITATQLRNQPSFGMLCSAQELGMSDHSEGIIELAADAPIGVDLHAYLSLNDTVFDIELTPNRGDCLSVYGVAREIAAKLNLPLQVPASVTAPLCATKTLAVTINATTACPRYCGRLLQTLTPQAETPLWMKERLRRVGIRCIHPIVDVTQYVMLEYGQPLHAFDAEKIGESICVRYAHDGEEITLIDGTALSLTPAVLVIANQQQSLALAGIMGGQASEVSEATTAIWLESAFFTPASVAAVARKYGLSSEAAYRFERGVDPMIGVLALERATALLQEIAGAVAAPIVQIQQAAADVEPVSVSFRPSQVLQHIGLTVPEAQMRQILSALGCQLLTETVVDQVTYWQLAIPSYRFDLSIEADIIEEIIRVYGYEHLPASPLAVDMRAGHLDPMAQLSQDVSVFFAALGYRQTVSYSFVDPELQQALFGQANRHSLVNPLSPELSEMRVSLWPGLLVSTLYNLNRQQQHVALFECGPVFLPADHDQRVEEVQMLGAVLTGNKPVYWGESASAWDFYDLKGSVQALFHHQALTVSFVTNTHPALHPGKSAALMVAGQCIGWCGVLHPNLAQILEIDTEVVLFECRLDAFPSINPDLAVHQKAYRPLSKYPMIRRDLALLVNETVVFSDIERVIRSVAHAEWFKSLEVFDVYKGPGIPEGKQSIAVTLWMQSTEGTLLDETIHTWIQQLLQTLQQELSITLRDAGI